ncbi:MAG: endolytic transglycosylase MltG [Candidatus Caldatribacteriota bacterium]|nr:endolytic transglycosylase MltG [Candidatus Caldatribacteriota bacterium]
MNFVNKMLFIFSLILLVLILFLTAIYFPAEENSPIIKIIQIPDGTNATEIKNTLIDNKIIKDNYLVFNIYIKIYKLENKLKYGEYTFSPSMNLIQIIDKLVKGEVLQHKITIPEGFSSEQIAELLNKKEVVEEKDFLDLVKNPEKSWEGYLFPDTYEVPKHYGSKKMLDVFLSNFNRVIEENKIRQLAEKMSFSLDNIIILASIIEKEARTYEEKKLVSSVFHNRLNLDMKLQSCATIYYILGNTTKKLDEYDLKIDSPFNTYINKGLPPGPICNPGIDSIKAAIEPSDEDYLYFVLGEDGKHIFSKTYKEHLRNKNNK